MSDCKLEFSPVGAEDANADFSQFWGPTAAWLERLKRLVDTEVTFSALKFANYLEAEIQLFRRMPELRAVCREACRLCRENPRVSVQVAARVGHLQATWLAVETRLAEFKPQRSLLAALSGDLKQLESYQNRSASPSHRTEQDDHDCCTRKIERLDVTVQRKDRQLQQMRSVAAAISRLLDWLCEGDLRVRPTRQRRRARRPNTPAAADQVSNAPGQSRTGSTTGSTTYLLTHSITDGDLGEPESSESSDIIAHTGIRNQNQNDNHEVMQMRQEESHSEKCSSQCCLMSPVLHAVSQRVATLKASTHVLHASLWAETAAPALVSSDASASEDSSGSQLSQLASAEVALTDWREELLGLRACVEAAVAAASPPEEAILRSAFLESIGLLFNWTASLRDRCRSKQLALRRSRDSRQSTVDCKAERRADHKST